MLAGGAAAGVFGSLLGLGGGVLIVPLLDARLRPAAARGGRRLARVRDHDQQRRRGRLPRAARREPAAGHDPGAVHRRAARWSAAPSRSCSTNDCWRSCSPACSSTSRSRWPGRSPRPRRRRGRGSPLTASAADAPADPDLATADPALLGAHDHATAPTVAGRRRRVPHRPVGRRLHGAQPRPRDRRIGGSGRRIGAPGHRRRDHQGAADAPRDGHPAARRDGHEQPDDRDHGGGERRDLPAPRRDRPVRRRPDGDRRVPRRDASDPGSAHRIQLRYLRILFVVVLLYTAVQMLLRAVG